MVAAVLNGEQNPFVKLEAAAENLSTCWTVLHEMGIDTHAKERLVNLRPDNVAHPGDIAYSLYAVERYLDEIFQYFAALLPDVYAHSEGETSIFETDEYQNMLRGLIQRHERRDG
jgi:hypothetical protein